MKTGQNKILSIVTPTVSGQGPMNQTIYDSKLIIGSFTCTIPLHFTELGKIGKPQLQNMENDLLAFIRNVLKTITTSIVIK